MMSGTNGIRQIIKPFVTGDTRITLTCGLRVIKAALDAMVELTRGSHEAVWPAHLADGLVPLHLIDHFLAIDLQRWAPGMI
jgi:hypothetical protein